MDIRKALNRHPVVSSLFVTLIVLLLGWYIWNTASDNPGVGRQFYTDDDGKTWYSDAAGKAVPFTRNGRDVVMAEVFESGDKKFVAYMRRYTASALDQLKNKNAQIKAGGVVTPRMEYKKPGDSKWHDIEGDVKAMSEYLKLDSYGTNLSQVEP